MSSSQWLHSAFSQTNDLILISNDQNQFVYANPFTAQLFGYANSEAMLGINAHKMRCPASDSAELFIKQDKQVLQSEKELTLLDIHTYANGESYILLTKKSLLINDQAGSKGILCHCREIKNTTFQRIGMKIANCDRYYEEKQGALSKTYQVINAHDTLTKREMECLFFLLRGKTMPETARILFLSHRTVENHIANIKSKLGCQKKSQIIEYGLQQGYLNLIPQSLLRYDVSITLD